MKTVYFVRHGESRSNILNLASGSEDNVHLTKKGRAQAKKVGEDLKNKSIELIVSSPMIRALDTAEIIAKEIGHDSKQIITQPLFIEINFGIYTRRPNYEYKQDLKDGKLHQSVETTESIYKRVTDGLRWLESFEEDRILLVAHGGVGRILRVVHQQLHHSKFWEVDKFGNTEIYEFNL